jgi:CheY-like chemotaxis protein
MKELLANKGHRVVIVANGQEVLDLLSRQPIDLILMDIMMPVMDGEQTTEKIRAEEAIGHYFTTQNKRIPIIALTAHAIKGDEDRFLAAGMDGYLTKPFIYENFYQTVIRVIPDLSVIPDADSLDHTITMCD